MNFKRIKYWFTVLVFIFTQFQQIFASNGIESENIYARLSALKCDSLMKANETNPNFVILDVRTPGEWSNYHILGSINRSTGLTDFTAQLDALPKHKIFLLHCQSGSRSAGAFQKMKDLQFVEVYEMIGGISAWRNAGLATTTVTEPNLMLVNYTSVAGNDADTFKITVTNRANGILTFTTAEFDDLHDVSSDFSANTQIQGAFDYTFSIIHSSGYPDEDSTKILLASNGGELDFTISHKDGIIQKTKVIDEVEVLVYPNPAQDKLYVKASRVADEISIMNMNGQTVMVKPGYEISNGIDINGLNNGVYFLKLNIDGRIQVKKFIVKH